MQLKHTHNSDALLCKFSTAIRTARMLIPDHLHKHIEHYDFRFWQARDDALIALLDPKEIMTEKRYLKFQLTIYQELLDNIGKDLDQNTQALCIYIKRIMEIIRYRISR